jgi:hypothetical protein
VSLSDQERTNELLLSIDTRLLMLCAGQREIEARLTWLENALRQRPSRESEHTDSEGAEAEGEPVARTRRRPAHAQVQRDNAILDALEVGPMTLTALARAINGTERLTHRETTSLYPVLQRLMRDGYVNCDERKRYALRREAKA